MHILSALLNILIINKCKTQFIKYIRGVTIWLLVVVTNAGVDGNRGAKFYQC